MSHLTRNSNVRPQLRLVCFPVVKKEQEVLRVGVFHMEVVGGVRDRVVQKERKGRQHSAKPMAVEEGVSTWGVRKALKGILTFALLMEVESDAAFTEVAIEQREGNPAFASAMVVERDARSRIAPKVSRGLLVSASLMEVVVVANSPTVVRVLKGALNSARLMVEEKGAPLPDAPREPREALLSVKDTVEESDVLSEGTRVCAPKASMEVPCIVSHMAVERDVLLLDAQRVLGDERTSVSAMVEGKGANPKVVKRACRKVPISARRMEEESGVCGANEVQDSVQTVRPLAKSL